MRHSARAGPALRGLSETDPAMAALALWCDHRDADLTGMAETTGTTILYGPAFEGLPRHEQTGLAAHHILHAALRHSARMALMQARMGEGFQPDLYAIATDAIVNEAVLAAGHALPRPAMRLTELLAAIGHPAPAAEALALWDADRLYLSLLSGGRKGRSAEAARAMAAASATPAADLHPVPDAGTEGDARTAADWRAHVSRAMEAGRLAGRGIGMVGHRMADLPHSATPWERVLRGLLSRATLPDAAPSHRRPARTWIASEAHARTTGAPTPAFQPGTARTKAVPRIAVALDTSSSIDDTRLAMFMAEVAGIARRTTAEVHLLPFDEAAGTALRLDPATWASQIATLNLARGGGTAFAPVIARAVTLGASILVLLTDLDGDPGPAPRGLPVIWAVPAALAPSPPPFGQMLSLAT